MMYVQAFSLCGLLMLFFNLALLVKALPASQNSPPGDDLYSIFSRRQDSLEGFDPAFLDSDVFSLDTNWYDLNDSSDLLASASAPADTGQSLFQDYDQPGMDFGSFANDNLFSDLGPASDPADYSLPDQTLALDNAGSDPLIPAGSPDVFMGDNPGGSSSAPSYVSSSSLTPEGKPLSDNFGSSNSVEPVEGTFSGDDSILNPVDLAKGSPVPDYNGIFGDEDPGADMFLSGDSSTTGSVNPSEDSSKTGSVNPAENSSKENKSKTKTTTLVENSSDTEPANLVDGSGNTQPANLAEGSSDTEPVNLMEDSGNTDSIYPAGDISSSPLDNTQGTLVVSGKNPSLEGTTSGPTCSGRKTPACCLSSTSERTLPGYKNGCVSCTCCFLSWSL